MRNSDLLHRHPICLEVWLLRALIVLLLVLTATTVSAAQDPEAPAPPAEPQKFEFFSGTIEDLPAGRITVSRNTLGKAESRTFLITADTKVEGRLRTGARVTVRYTAGEEGDVAVHIIVRAADRKP